MSLREAVRIRLTMQGFACGLDPGFDRVAPWLRWTPVLSTLAIGIGTLLQQPVILWSFAFVAAVGACGWHLFDALFNHAARHLFGVPPLPANPVPRRFAMALAAVWSACTGLFFAGGWRTAGLVSGVLLLGAALTVAWTQFCIGSWVWHLLRGPGRLDR